MTDAIKRAKKKILVSRIPIIGVSLIMGVLAWRTWKVGGGWGQYAAVALAALGLLDAAHGIWQERRDPALVDYSRGTLHFHWISGRSMDVGVSSVRRVRIQENTYWQFRRLYPKWVEIELEVEPKRVLVDEMNLKPSARELLTRMSHSKGSRSAIE